MKTDKGFYSIWSGGFNQSFSDELGSRRAINTVVWQNDFDNLYIGLQYQARRDVASIGFGNGATYGSALIGVGSQSTDSGNDSITVSKDITIKSGMGAAIAYTFESTGTYVAAGYNRSDDISGDVVDIITEGFVELRDAEFSQYSVAAEQHFMEGAISVSGRYEHYDSKDGAASTSYEVSGDSFGVGANMYLNDQWRIFTNYEMGKEKNEQDGSTNNEFSMITVGTGYAPVAWGEIYLEAYNDKIEFAQEESKGTHFFLGAAVFF
jgi:predicted porin